MIKKILLSIASIFLLWQSFELVRKIDENTISSWWLIVFVAWLTNLFITGIFAFAGFAFPTQKLLPARYYKIQNPQKIKSIYKLLKVAWFRQALLATLWKSQSQRKNYFNGRKNGVANLEEQSMKAEFGHLVPFILILLVSFYWLYLGAFQLGVFAILINIIGNLYPIILQKHHRMRVQAMKDRQLMGSRFL